MRPAVALLADRDQRVEQPPAHLRGQRRPAVRDGRARARSPAAASVTSMRLPGALKLTALSTSLSSSCAMSSPEPTIVAAAHVAAIGDLPLADRRRDRPRSTTRRRRRDRTAAQRVSRIACSSSVASLIAARMRVEPLRALPQAPEILLGRRRLDLVLEVVERRRHDGERRAQLVRELARERAQILRVLAQALEQLGEAARERAELVARGRARHAAADLAARAERASAPRPRAGARAATTTSRSRAGRGRRRASRATSASSSARARDSSASGSARSPARARRRLRRRPAPDDRHGRRDDRLALGPAAIPRRRALARAALAAASASATRPGGPLRRIRRVLALEQPAEKVRRRGPRRRRPPCRA